jgi:hypothetical protein
MHSGMCRYHPSPSHEAFVSCKCGIEVGYNLFNKSRPIIFKLEISTY